MTTEQTAEIRRSPTPPHVFQAVAKLALDSKNWTEFSTRVQQAGLKNEAGGQLGPGVLHRIAKQARGGAPWEAPLLRGAKKRRKKRGPYGARKTPTEAPKGRLTVLGAIYGKVDLGTFLQVLEGL